MWNHFFKRLIQLSSFSFLFVFSHLQIFFLLKSPAKIATVLLCQSFSGLPFNTLKPFLSTDQVSLRNGQVMIFEKKKMKVTREEKWLTGYKKGVQREDWVPKKGYPFALLVLCFAVIHHLYVVQRHMFYGCQGDSFRIPCWLHKQ